MKRCLIILVFGICFIGCGGPEVDPIPASSNPNGNPSISSSSSDDTQREKRRVIVDFDVTFMLVDEITSNPVSGALVYYDVFLNRPYAPYMDAYLVSNNVPGETSVTTRSSGIGDIDLEINVSDDARDEIAFMLQLYGEADQYANFSGVVDLFVRNDISKDTLSMKRDTIQIKLKPL